MDLQTAAEQQQTLPLGEFSEYLTMFFASSVALIIGGVFRLIACVCVEGLEKDSPFHKFWSCSSVAP